VGRIGEQVSRTDWVSVRIPERRPRQRGEDTRRRLILRAAELFAERGIDGVSTQEIVEAAGQHNASAIQYHFGSRAGLVVAVLQPRLDVRGPIEADREARLAVMARGREPPSLRWAVETMVVPSLAYLHSQEGRSLIRVAAQVMRTLPLEARVDPMVPTDRAVTALIASLLPGSLPETIRRERMGVARTLFVELVANRARELDHGLVPHLDEHDFAREAVAMTVGLLSAT
jgi:AcrR family transcriptional regulator